MKKGGRRGEARRDGKRQRSVGRRNGKPNNNNMMMLQSNYKLRTSKFMLYDKIIALEHELNMNTVPGRAGIRAIVFGEIVVEMFIIA